MSTLGHRLKKLREEHNLTQERAGKIFGLTKYQIHRYESGASSPDPEMIKEFADYYGVSADYLLGRTANPHGTRDKESTPEKTADPSLDLFLKELKEAPEEQREQLRKIWEIIKGEDKQKPQNKES
ncbi:transcriptional regulator with XRE-family HTH domain [Anoxybacillus vitaminiphilus]|uniref:Transcriptional regulator with XRE-family HTH domain n=1 Tax=Paranoxybacillus vitaminiphilus TaxID=581036 RepID=A0A327YE83_9BACL|nr:helix-turn-helix transcriptional regulator [Anoxybacillus vitaminiphilus]RAK19144.1 transcriptional regulator with XRE-family HTH domain [Anoxybacillus vitaminiphilus]